MAELGTDAEAQIRRLVDDYRASCLWFLDEGYYPRGRQEALRVLAAIEAHGDRAGYVRASRMRRWLSPPSSGSSVASSPSDVD